jgi:aspartate aminotransferase-like enzyme
MKVSRDLIFKKAESADEIEQIKALNYETFVEEIPQHASRPDRTLTDRFHGENEYFVCKDGETVVGMVAVRDRRPFSLDQKLPNLDSYLPPAKSVCEIRLLAVKRAYRHTRVFAGLIGMAGQYSEQTGHDMAVISGHVRQQRLYEHMGFVPFGPVVGAPSAPYQPMYLTVATYQKVKEVLMQAGPGRAASLVNLLPGPVHIRPEVAEALADPAISHRSPEFMELHRGACERLCRMVRARHVQIGLGTGTLANDMIGAQISLLPGRGVILSNGEFGDRLVDHATRWGLDFDVVRDAWGSRFEEDRLRRELAGRANVNWLWAVHCETSTGVLNDMDAMKRVCRERGIRLCLDCISSIATTKVDLEGVWMASGVSGKALGGYTGLALVFHEEAPDPASQREIPRYLDLSMYTDHEGVPFSMSSNLLNALYTAVDGLDIENRTATLVELSQWLRDRLRAMGLPPLAPDAYACPAVVTIPLLQPLTSREVGQKLADEGFLLSYGSGYLLARNWIQICMMRDASKEMLEPVLKALARIARHAPPSA